MRKRKTEENDYLSSFIDKLQTNKLRIGLEKDAYTLIIQELI